MINEDTVLSDNLADDVCDLLKSIKESKSWTKSKRSIVSELKALLKSKGYIAFYSGYSRYLISRVGDSYLYDVPLYKQGNLKPFRGKRVRIVCTESGEHCKRKYMAGVICDTPEDLIVEKLIRNYTFPKYSLQNEAIYKTERYLIFRAHQALEIFSEEEPEGYVNLKEWDSIFVDGKIGEPKGKLRHNKNGTITAAVLGWKGSRTFSSIKEAAEYLKEMTGHV